LKRFLRKYEKRIFRNYAGDTMCKWGRTPPNREEAVAGVETASFSVPYNTTFADFFCFPKLHRKKNIKKICFYQ